MEKAKFDISKVMSMAKMLPEFRRQGVIGFNLIEPEVLMTTQSFFEIFGDRTDITEKIFTNKDGDVSYFYKFIEQGVIFKCIARERVDLQTVRERTMEQMNENEDENACENVITEETNEDVEV